MAYTGWKAIRHARSSGVVTKEMAERYTSIQQYHPQFFGLVENSFLTSFVILVLHPFDKDLKAYSLFKVDQLKTEKFITDNKSILDALKNLRNKVFAHRDMEVTSSTIENYQIPSVDSLDIFFANLMEFYNKLCEITDNSYTVFDNAKDVKYDIEELYMNLYRGEKTRNTETDIKWMWEEDKNKISDVI